MERFKLYKNDTCLSSFGYIVAVIIMFIVWEVIFLGQMPGFR